MWFRQFLDPRQTQVELMGPGEAHVHRINQLLYEGQSRFQSIQIVETAHCGMALVLDGRIQSSQFDEFVYHEALVHPGLLAHPKPEKVLCIGGGPGAVVREVLRHPTVRQVTLVDIDGEVVEVSKKYLPHMHLGALDDPRTHVIIGDGRTFIEETKEQFDAVILDLSEPLDGTSPASYLYTREFYDTIRSKLTDNGLLMLQAGTANSIHMKLFPSTVSTLKSIFSQVSPYWEHIQCFGTVWSYIIASKLETDIHLLSVEETDRRIAVRGLQGLRFYEGAAHQRMFLLPKYITARLNENWPVVTIENVVYTFSGEV
jgi:spermidine synthase